MCNRCKNINHLLRKELLLLFLFSFAFNNSIGQNQKMKVVIVKGHELYDGDYIFRIDGNSVNYDARGYDMCLFEKSFQPCPLEFDSDMDGTFPYDSVELVFTIIKKPGRYVYARDTIKLDRDTIYYQAPPLPNEKEALQFIGKDKREKKRRNIAHFFKGHNNLISTFSYYHGRQSFGEFTLGPAVYARIGFAPWRFSKHEAVGFISNFNIGSEFNFLGGSGDFILGPKMGYNWSSVLVNFGLHGVYYTNFQDGIFCLKPRIGLNPLTPLINISYSYAIPIGNNPFGDLINGHQLCLNLIIPIWIKNAGSADDWVF